MAGGRPSAYTIEIAQQICDRMAAGDSINRITDDEEMPSRSMIYRWLGEHPEFRDKYAQAQIDRADVYAEQIAAIADDTSGDVQRDRLRVDARKWIAARLMPKKYGDRVTQDVNLNVNDMSTDDLKSALREIFAKQK